MTQEKKYSLSKETKELLNNLEDIIYLKIYLHGEIPIEYKKLENEIKYMVNEFRAYSKFIEYEFIDPNAIQNDEYRVNLQEQLYKKGIYPVPIRNYDKTKMEQFLIFPGIIASHISKETTISLINQSMMHNQPEIINESIEQLEYLLTNGIRTLQRIKKPKIGLINGHGETTNELITSFKDKISEHYELIDIEINEQLTALKNFDCIIINDPKQKFSEKDKFIIDQFIMHGGKSIWITNGNNANMDSLEKKSETIILSKENRNLDDLLFKYGVRINLDLVQDIQATPIPVITHYIDNKPQWDFFPWFFFPVLTPHLEHVVTNHINPVQTKFPSSIDTIKNNVDKTVLLQTSPYTKISSTPAVINLENLKNKADINTFNSGTKNIAVLLSGEFASVYANRINPIIGTNTDINFKNKSIQNKMIIISDSYFIKNQFFQGQPMPLGLDKHTGTQYGNGEFILNSIDYLLDNSQFIKIRSKNRTIRILNAKKLDNETSWWQIINLILPLIILILSGIIIFIIRKHKYAKLFT
tara:strand:+ start:326 stop:1909 length:1584 start_codon:yes stop_codon:yes gene_type:complete